jgi:hypothetical protein
MSGGPGQQRHGSDGGGRRAGVALVREQGKGRKGGWPVGHPAGWGPASGGEGGYDRWVQAGEIEKEEKKTEIKSNLKISN